MIRVWAVAMAYFVSMLMVFLLGPLGGQATLLTAGVPIGAGIAVALVCTGGYLMRALWMTVGVLLSSLGYVVGGLVMPDTPFGLVMGGSVPVLLLALLTMWTRRQSHFVAGLLGIGALAGVFAVRFNADPQGMNTALPIAIGQTLLPLGVGYIAGMLAALMPDDDTYFANRAQRKSQPVQSPSEAVTQETET